MDTIYVANSVCLLLGLGLGEDGLYYRADEAVMQRSNLTERDLEDVGLQVTTELKRVEQAFTNDGEADPSSPAVERREQVGA